MAAVVVEKIFNAAGCTHVVKISLYVILDFIPKTTEESHLGSSKSLLSLPPSCCFLLREKILIHVIFLFSPGQGSKHLNNYVPRLVFDNMFLNNIPISIQMLDIINNRKGIEKQEKLWQRWDSYPRPRRDWCLKPAP